MLGLNTGHYGKTEDPEDRVGVAWDGLHSERLLEHSLRCVAVCSDGGGEKAREVHC